MDVSDFDAIVRRSDSVETTVPLTSVLIVDDDAAAGKLLSLILGAVAASRTVADSATQALAAMERESFDAVISDLRMPGMSGLELLAETRRKCPHMAFLVTTGVEELDVAVHAMRSGADDYLVKPLREEVVIASLERALHRRRLEREVENRHRSLERLVGERTEQLRHALQHIQRSYEETLQALGTAIDLRDGETAGHSWRVCRYSLDLATAMNIPENERRNLAHAAYLHDIGKLGVPDRILLKPGPLTNEEWVLMRAHAQLGFELLKTIPFLAEAAEVVLAHHERFDGSGYPRGLHGKQTPLGARIFAIADAFDAITSDRPYRPASTLETACSMIARGAGSQFDPHLVDIFSEIPSERWRGIANDRRRLPPATSKLVGLAP